ncbi:MAG: hypothetical protein L6V93_05520 [Clostridiales bacterium]|nr:MAG: hypothetical protein L6V93_05520 [Clostridiales bacterium]
MRKKYNCLILEDNPYGELRFRGEDVAAIKSFDDEGRVMYVGSFSKNSFARYESWIFDLP